MLVFHEINDLHQALSSPVRALYPEIHVFRGEDTLPAIRTEMPAHRNQFYEIGLITKGVINSALGGQRYHLDEQTHLYFATPGQLRQWQREGSWKGIICMFKGELLHWGHQNIHIGQKFSYFGPDMPRVLMLSLPEKSLIERLFEVMLYEYEQKTPFTLNMLSAYLQVLLMKIQRVYITKISLEKSAQKGQSQQLAVHFMELVQKNAVAQPYLAFYADLLHVSIKHLEKTVRQQLGQTASQIIKAMIVEEAKSLLLQTKISIAQIALELHFEEVSYFVKFFKRYTGLTPLDFRNKHQNYL